MTSTASAPPDLAAVAADVFERHSRELGFAGDSYPAAVKAAHDDLRDGVAEVIRAGRQLEQDVAELRGKRDLIPAQGYMRLKSEALQEASSAAESGTRRATLALARLKEELTTAALPKVDRQRESLARQELDLLIGPATGTPVLQRVLRIAETGSRDAAGALLSDFGRSLLEARGLSGRDLAEALKVAREVSARNAPGRNGSTVEEIMAAKALERADSLGAAIGGAGGYFQHAAQDASK